MTKSRSIRAALALLLAAAGAGFIGDRYIFPVSVDYYPVKPRLMALNISGPGLLDAINKVTITARIQGFLISVEVDKNDRVHQGQLLAQLLSADIRNQLLAAQSDAKAAKNAISEAESERDRAVATLNKNTQDFERRSALVATNTISKADFSNSEAAFKDSQANLARATTAIERAKAQSGAADANVEVLQAKLAEATIRSPINGVVVSRERNVGDLLIPGIALMQLVDPDTIVVSARFDESNMSAIHAGDSAQVRFISNPDKVYVGRVFRLIRQVDQETREFIADIKLDQLPDDWAMGQRAKVAVEAKSPELTLSVPRDYISRDDGRAGVWVERGNRAVWVPVTLGYLSGDNIQIIHGLEPGVSVINPQGRYLYQPIRLTKALN